MELCLCSDVFFVSISWVFFGSRNARKICGPDSVCQHLSQHCEPPNPKLGNPVSIDFFWKGEKMCRN